MDRGDGATGPGREAGKSKRRRGLLRVTAVLVAGAAAGIPIGLALPVASSPRLQVVDTNVQLPDPIEQLKAARAAAPYHVRFPSQLPAGTKLLLVDWYPEGDRVDVDLWFTLPGFPPGGGGGGNLYNGRLYIWQTNHPLGHTWVGEGWGQAQAMTIAGREWTATLVHPGTDYEVLELSTRFDDGITLAVAADRVDASWEVLAEVAASLA